MADSRLHQVLDRIRTQIRVANAVSPYVYNLTAAEAVQFSAYNDPPPVLPMVFLTGVTGDTSETGSATRATNLGRYYRTWTIGFIGVVAVDPTDVHQANLTAAADLLSDISIALENNRELFLSGGSPEKAVERLQIKNHSVSVSGAFEAPGYGLCEGEIEVSYQVAQGVSI